jgi:hypothetical protein
MQHNKHTNCLINKLLQMKQLILLTTVFFIFFSCKKAYTPVEILCTLSKDSSIAKKYIKGNWEWLEEKTASQTQGKYIYSTPKTEGYNVKMIIGDSTIDVTKNTTSTIYKYKIQLYGEITGFYLTQDDYQATLVFYKPNSMERITEWPIKICNEYLMLQGKYSSNNGDQIWRKQ